MLFSALFGLYFGTYVDHHKKRTAMISSSIVTLISFSIATIIYVLVPQADLLSLTSFYFWLLVLVVMIGAVTGNMRLIALSTTVTMLVPEDRHDRANGLVGTANGLAFTLTSVFSGLAIGMLGMGWTLGLSVTATTLVLLHMTTIHIKEKHPDEQEDQPKKVDIKGTIRTIRQVPGLMALLFFATFNNFLGGVYMSLMDPYGLSIVSVEAWGVLWGIVSLGFIIGGLVIAKKGLTHQPLRMLFLANIVMWIVSIAFPIRTSIILLAIGMFIYMCLIPVVEAAEQTIIQKVVPFKRQGRVFGFGQTLENAASPITSFLIGPIAQFWVIPYMTDGAGARSIGSWFGTGAVRGMALIFVVAGTIGLVITLLAMSSRSYHILSKYYRETKVDSEDLPLSPRV